MDAATLARMKALIPVAQKWSAQTGIPAEVFLAINNFESVFGNNPKWGALFGMTGSGPAGQVTLKTSAGPLTFAAYNSPDEAYEHFVRVVSTAPNYATAWKNRADPAAFFAGLQAGGYAGDHNDLDRAWSKNITATIDSTIRPAMKQAGVQPGQTAHQPAVAPGQQTQDPAKVDAFGAVVALGQKEIGKRYAGPIVGEADAARWGTPGWDCSSFVSGVYKQMGVKLTPYTDAAYGETRSIKEQDARPGDIIFYRGGSPAQPNIAYHHMGIYLGEGKVLSALYDGGVQVHDIAAPDGIKKGWEIRRAQGIETAQVPEVARQAVATGQQLAAGGQVGGGARQGGAAVTTPTQPVQRSETDPRLSRALTLSEEAVNRAQTRVQRAQAALDKATTPAEKAQLAGAVEDEQQILDAAVRQWSGLLAQDKAQPAAAQQSEAAMLSARNDALNTQINLYNSIIKGLDTAFGHDAQIATLVWQAIDANVKNSQAYYNSLLNKQQIDVQSYASLLTADAAKQAAHVSAAMESRQVAAQIGEQERWNAINLINDGVIAANIPGLPDLNAARTKLGLPPMNVPINRVDPARFDPERLMARGRTAANIPNPDAVFNPDLVSMRSQIRTNQQLQIPKPKEITFGTENDPAKGVVKLPGGNIPASMLGQNGEIPEWLAAHIDPIEKAPPAGAAPATSPPTGAFGRALSGVAQTGQQANAAIQGVARNPSSTTIDVAGQQGFSGPNSFQSGAGARNPEGGVGFDESEWMIVGDENGRRLVRRGKGALNPAPAAPRIDIQDLGGGFRTRPASDWRGS